ncbi:LXG domain-containing protein [Shouchella miscanthi]|uniref:LXG domain-containing protein n=1 Tax=Shouchella miscanthi TaxID=2598861 RepID=A0ABU6NPX2_9BACI|nr:LXG domain-containing protein [Shouchella miscanthi]
MKVLDVQEVMDAIDKIKISKQQDSDNIESLRASIQKIEQLETLQGKGGEALKDHFRRLHLPVLEAFHLLIRQYMEQLDRVKSNLLGFESSSAIVREEFLSGELKNGLDRIATTATEDANEIESIRTSISDILPLTPFSMEGVLRQVDRGKDHAKETIETLHALDEQNEALLAQAESTLREVTNVVSQVANWSSGGAILSAETLAEVDANVEALYANLVTEAIQMTPPDPFDLTGHESVMYQTALPLEFLYTGAYANIPGGLEAMSWYYMNQFPVSAMMNNEQAIQACVAPPVEQDVDEGGGWLKATFNFFKGLGSGAVNAVGDAVEGVVNLVTDPIGVYNDTVEFIGAIVDDPALVKEIATELWNTFQDDMINGDAQSRGEWTGYALGLIGTAVVGDKGVSKIANASRVSTAGRIGGVPGYGTQHQVDLSLRTTQGMNFIGMGASAGPALAFAGNGSRAMPPYNTLNTTKIHSDVGDMSQTNVKRVESPTGATETQRAGSGGQTSTSSDTNRANQTQDATTINPTDKAKIDEWKFRPSDDKYLTNKKTYDNPQYYNQETGDINWPPNNGFDGDVVRTELKPGQVIDRYGEPGGEFSFSRWDALRTKSVGVA